MKLKEAEDLQVRVKDTKAALRILFSNSKVWWSMYISLWK